MMAPKRNWPDPLAFDAARNQSHREWWMNGLTKNEPGDRDASQSCLRRIPNLIGGRSRSGHRLSGLPLCSYGMS